MTHGVARYAPLLQGTATTKQQNTTKQGSRSQYARMACYRFLSHVIAGSFQLCFFNAARTCDYFAGVISQFQLACPNELVELCIHTVARHSSLTALERAQRYAVLRLSKCTTSTNVGIAGEYQLTKCVLVLEDIRIYVMGRRAAH